MSAPPALRRSKAREPCPTEMTHQASLIPGEKAFTGDASAGQKEIECAGAALTNPG
jgi:hypothetical protein